MNLGNATGHPSFVMSNSFSNQVLWPKSSSTVSRTKSASTACPSAWTEKVAAIHVEALNGHLTKLTPTQAKYLGVPAAGPYKADHYRY